jgi:hypothetical protein
MNEISNKRISFLRHEGWVGPADLKDPINIIGCGAVGSHAAVLAARMGFTHFRLWDEDVVSDYNVGNQAFFSRHIDMPKVEALAWVLNEINPGIKIEKYQRRFTSETDGTIDGAMYLAVDSMAARADIYKVFYLNALITVVVEQRLGFDHGEVNIIDPLDINALELWHSSLVDDADVPEGPCNLRICPDLVQATVALGIHNVAAYYASIRFSSKWDFVPRTIFRLSEDLTILKLK